VVGQQYELEGPFEISLPPGSWVVRFSAEGHQSEEIRVEIHAGELLRLEPLLLFRGQRISRAAPSRMFWRYDEAWFFWEEEGGFNFLSTTATQELHSLGAEYEVFIGHIPGEEAITLRFHGRPGLAGDLYRLPLEGGPPQLLFEEAQPWIRWIEGEALALTHTREALSRLERVQPGAPPQVLGEGVPWLMVTDLQGGRVAWMEAEVEGHSIWISPEGPGEQLRLAEGASSAFLMSYAGRTGLLWSAGGDLLSWDGQRSTILAEEILESPPPRDYQGLLLFWREGGDLYALEEGAERLILEGAQPSSLRLYGPYFAAFRPEAGLEWGRLDGAERLLHPCDSQLSLSLGETLFFVVDGVLFRSQEGAAAERLLDGVDDLLVHPPLGISVLAPELIFLPKEGAPLPLAGVQRVLEPGGGALYFQGAEGWQRQPLPTGAASVPFGADLEEIWPVNSQRLMGQAEGQLFSLDLNAGVRLLWAEGLERLLLSPRRGMLSYSSSRGLFLLSF